MSHVEAGSAGDTAEAGGSGTAADEDSRPVSESLVESSVDLRESVSEVKDDVDHFAFKNIKDDSTDEGSGNEDGDSDRSYDDDDPNDILEVEGFLCPKHLVPKLTPMEFEEMVHLFKTYDANDSGDIDKHEARKILLAMDMEATLEKAEELMALVDQDGSGEIEFDEFCEFIVLIKDGDERFRKFDSILENVSQTPLGALEKASGQQGFTVTFQTVEERGATATNPPVYVVELSMAGLWFERDMDTGVTTSNEETRKFQGLGSTNREAKYNACKAGTVKLRQMMPGVAFKEGEFNDEWITWVDENLFRGIDPLKIVSILAAKGFHPHRNDALMQRIITWQSFDLFLARNGSEFNVDNTTVIDTDFRFWVEKCSRKGIDGDIILTVLRDRAIRLEEEFPHFAQQLKNNELGYLMDKNGNRTKFMSFWTCCEDGNIEDVMIYLEARQPVNEEIHLRSSGVIQRPLSIAAQYGRTACCKVLVSRGALVNEIDRRGRTALHTAASFGHLETCKYLIEAGAMMFEGDFGGNTALHFAAFFNHIKVVDYLCWQGQEHTRAVCSDKCKPTSKMNFEQLSCVVFEKIQLQKLTIRDLRRVEKSWLHDCATLFRQLCDTKPRSMIAHSCEEIMNDVLLRFDPRPETGVFMIKGVAGESVFVPSIANGAELAVLLRFVYKQAAIDSVNSWKRTALHVACDNNKIDSHAPTIYNMMDVYGCNTYLKDMHKRRPMELLFLDRNFPGVPSSTQVREEFVFAKRDMELSSLTSMFDKVEKDRQNIRREKILEECASNSEVMSLDLWDIVRTASMLVTKYQQWEKYEDMECLNFFYAFKPKHMMDGQRYGPYQWIEEPEEIKVKVEWDAAVKYLTHWKAEKLNKFGRWQQFRHVDSHLDFYYDEARSAIRFATPKDATWAEAKKDSRKQETVGYSMEWDVVKDNRSGNLFYRDNRTGECTWDKPIDAVLPETSEKFCTATTKKGKAGIMQKYYVCEQCNRAWKTSAEGAKVNMRICEPCIFRCHDGHKGIRYVRELECVCICEAACRVANCTCNARVISESQLKRQEEAYQERVENSRRREHAALMPPILAMVPMTWPDGSPKRLTGWQLCRRPALQGFDQFGAPPEDNDESTVMTTDSTHTSNTGSFYRNQPVPLDAIMEISELEEYPFEAPEGLPVGWIEVTDPEDSEEIRKKTRVLVRQIRGFEFIYATVIEVVKIGFYKVKYDVPIGGTDGYINEVVHRERIQSIMRPTFFCNIEEGKSAWTVKDAAGKNGEDKIFNTSPLCLTGPEWESMYVNSTNRRTFGSEMPDLFEERIDKSTNLLYFANVYTFLTDKAARRIQVWVRRHWRMPLKVVPWESNAYTMYPGDSIKEQMRLRSGWSYLRRRSSVIGEFLSLDGDEWEEYVDKDTSEYFYWQEDDNRYLWEKPPLPARNVVDVKYHPIGAECLFRFPNERDEEMSLITRLRFDDETGGDCYDIVHKYDKEKVATWLPRMRIKLKPAASEEFHLVRAEKQWKNVLRRARDKEARADKRRKDEQDAADLKRLEELRLGIVREEDADLKVSPVMMLARHRQTRLEAEAKHVKDEKERIAGAKRRELTRQEMDVIKDEALARGERISRADILSMTKAIDMRLLMEDRITERNLVQIELDKRKKENRERIVTTEVKLRSMEVVMTTPRSLRRRGLMRKLHVGMRRQEDCYMVCEWGCGDWVRFGHDQLDHQMKRCTKRILPCTLGCDVKNSEEDWLSPAHPKTDEKTDEMLLTMSADQITEQAEKQPDVTMQQWHELEECVKRLVICPRQCLEWVCFERLEEHLNELCTKRPAEPIFCRLGCNKKFGGLVEKLIEAEDELMEHETEQCEFRTVRCNWKFEDGTMCAAQMQAKDRTEHRDYHLVLLGVTTYSVGGTYLYRVPKGIERLKVQCWGGGGGSGYFKHRRSSDGGGGAYVEVLLIVEPYDVLEIVVGTGGGAGTTGTEIQALDIDYQRLKMTFRRQEETFLSKEDRIARKAHDNDVIDAECGITLGGLPGGGEGYGGGGYWACGGGGGYTIISKRTPKGNQALCVAAGGGGGGSVPGLPGGNMEGELVGTRIDPISGGTATATQGGLFGDSGTSFNSKWPASSGEMWKGGNGSEFGAGGGGGYFGGGGGGTQPGIGGGGGGGASYVYLPKAWDHIIIPGEKRKPGGLDCDPPDAVGAGDWDKVGGLVGEGGTGHVTETQAGRAGCVRISKPGFY